MDYHEDLEKEVPWKYNGYEVKSPRKQAYCGDVAHEGSECPRQCPKRLDNKVGEEHTRPSHPASVVFWEGNTFKLATEIPILVEKCALFHGLTYQHYTNPLEKKTNQLKIDH